MLAANDLAPVRNYRLEMPRPTRIHQGKHPRRFHYIPEWAKQRQVKQSDIARDLGADKSAVSRWFDGTLPQDKYLIALTEYFSLDEPADLFRHPNDDWMTRLLRGRPKEEQERIRATIEAAFPRKSQRGV